MVGKKLKAKGHIIAGKKVSVDSSGKKNDVVIKALENIAVREKKEEKVNAKKMASKKSTILFFGTGAIVLLIIISIWVLFFYSPYRFSVNIDGYNYLSNEETPSVFFEQLKQENEFYISPVFVEGTTEQMVVNSSQLWIVLLNYNQVSAIQLIRVTDTTGNLNECYTNWGDTKKSEVLSAENCQNLINDANKAHIFIDKGGTEQVVLEGKNVYISYSSTAKVSDVSLSALEQLYPDARATLERINAIIGQIG